MTDPCSKRILVEADVVRSRSHLPPANGNAEAVVALNARVRTPVVPVAVTEAKVAKRLPL